MSNSAQILVVDDTPANLEIITETLGAAGYTVSTAISGDRALKRLQIYPPDLILLDVRMPGIDGFETCRQIKANPDMAKTPVIFITALSETAQIAEGFALGAVDYINKPFHASELLARVRTHLQIQQMNRILEQRVVERTQELEVVLGQLKASQLELLQLNRELEQANQQLEDYSRTLEDRVEARTTDLKAAQKRILEQEKLASLGTLTAGVAHELRNPLNFVKNYAEGSVELSQDLLEILQPMLSSLEADIADEVQALVADLRENSTTICHHSQRAGQIIESMMQHAHVDYERITPKPIRLCDLLDRAVKLVCHSKHSPENNRLLSVQTNYDTDLDLIHGVSSSLLRAFINLIENAYDAMQLKKRYLAADDPEADYTPTLCLSIQNLGGQAEIRIRDNGCGVDPTIQAKILDPFFTTKPPGKGNGLGLSLTYDIIVKQHHGTLVLESKPGECTECVLRLPI